MKLDISGSTVVIVGLGETGLDTALALLHRGARVRVTEKRAEKDVADAVRILRDRGVTVETGRHTRRFFEGASLVIPSPAVSPGSPPLVWAKQMKIPIMSEIEIAYRLSPSRKIVAITGTNGKTTTTALVDQLFECAGIPHVTCGNIGNCFIGELEKISRGTWIILEVSSFQLAFIDEFRPRIGVLLNIAQDHLDYYSSFNDYVCDKKRLFENQGPDDWAVLNANDPLCVAIGASISSRKIFFSSSGKLRGGIFARGSKILRDRANKDPIELVDFASSRLFGIHNLENVMAVAGVSEVLGFPRCALKEAVAKFSPMPHRLEKIRTVDGITFFDDSKATNVDSVKRALESFPERRTIILILGGKDKRISFAPLIDPSRKRVKLLLLIGEAAARIEKELAPSGVRSIRVKDLHGAVGLARKYGKSGDSVLLSPGCSSFDMFSNYKERGDVFKRAVEDLL